MLITDVAVDEKMVNQEQLNEKDQLEVKEKNNSITENERNRLKELRESH